MCAACGITVAGLSKQAGIHCDKALPRGYIVPLVSPLEVLYVWKRQLKASHRHARSKVGGLMQQPSDASGGVRRQQCIILRNSGNLLYC